MAAHRALGATLMWLGAVAVAHTHFAQGIALYDPQQHRAAAFLYGDDAGVICHSFSAWTLWFLGYPDQGLVRSHETVTLAQQVIGNGVLRPVDEQLDAWSATLRTT